MGKYEIRHSGRVRERAARASQGRSNSSTGFTLIDVLVSVAVVAVLIGLLLPSLSSVGESAKRVICQSNLRQVGMTLAMYADNNNDKIPGSVFLPNSALRTSKSQPEQMVTLRIQGAAKGLDGQSSWDGLGVLFEKEFVSAPKLFYCPSHKGNHPYRKYNSRFGMDQESEIIGNYHYRGIGPNLSGDLHGIKPEVAAIVADGMRIRSDYNHKTGFNVLRANLAVEWVKDVEGRISDMLPTDQSVGSGVSTVTDQIWQLLDKDAGHP